MNVKIATEVYDLYYEGRMLRSVFDKQLEEGLSIIANDFNNTDQTEAYRIAMLYSEQAMLHLLKAE